MNPVGAVVALNKLLPTLIVCLSLTCKWCGHYWANTHSDNRALSAAERIAHHIQWCFPTTISFAWLKLEVIWIHGKRSHPWRLNLFRRGQEAGLRTRYLKGLAPFKCMFNSSGPTFSTNKFMVATETIYVSKKLWNTIVKQSQQCCDSPRGLLGQFLLNSAFISVEELYTFYVHVILSFVLFCQACMYFNQCKQSSIYSQTFKCFRWMLYWNETFITFCKIMRIDQKHKQTADLNKCT